MCCACPKFWKFLPECTVPPSLIENETRIAKLPPATRMRGATVQCRACAAGAFHMCGCKIDNRETKLHHLPIHNSKADLRFLHCYVAKEGGRIQSGHSLPFRFGSIGCETRIAKLSPVTCMRGATALCFQPLLFPHVW